MSQIPQAQVYINKVWKDIVSISGYSKVTRWFMNLQQSTLISFIGRVMVRPLFYSNIGTNIVFSAFRIINRFIGNFSVRHTISFVARIIVNSLFSHSVKSVVTFAYLRIINRFGTTNFGGVRTNVYFNMRRFIYFFVYNLLFGSSASVKYVKDLIYVSESSTQKATVSQIWIGSEVL